MSWGARFNCTCSRKTNSLIVLTVLIAALTVVSPVFGFQSNQNKNTLKVANTNETPFIKTSDSNKVYFQDESKKYLIDSLGTFLDFLSLGQLQVVEQNYLNTLESAGTLPNVVGSTVDSNLYLIAYGYKNRFNSCLDAQSYGLSCTPEIRLTPSQLSKFANGPTVSPLVKSNSNKTVYYVKAGKKLPIASMHDLFALNVGSVITLASDSFLSTIPTDDVLVTGGALIKTADSVKVYAVNNWSNDKSVFLVNSFSDTIDLGLGYNVRTVTNSQLAKYEVEETLNSTVKCNSRTYVGGNGTLYPIDSSQFSHFGVTSNSFLLGGEICERFVFSNSQASRYIKNGVSIYYLENGTKRKFTSMRAFQEHGGDLENVMNVGYIFVDSIPHGSPINATLPRGENEIAYDLLTRVNVERAARGLHSLVWNGYLNSTARNWSIQMANSNSFAHSNLYPLLNSFHTVAENIGLAGVGAKSGALHNAWMNSTGHRVNLLARNLEVIGIGVYCAPDGRMWVTQQFGRWPNSSIPSTFGPTPPLNPVVMNDGGGATC